MLQELNPKLAGVDLDAVLNEVLSPTDFAGVRLRVLKIVELGRDDAVKLTPGKLLTKRVCKTGFETGHQGWSTVTTSGTIAIIYADQDLRRCFG